MKKTHKVVMLPTNNNSLLYRSTNCSKDIQKLGFFIKTIGTGLGDPKKVLIQTSSFELLRKNCEPQHLYILSDEEIKEGDWYLTSQNELVKNEDNSYNRERNYSTYLSKKIIATTDKYLEVAPQNSNGIRYILPQIPESFIQAYIKTYNEGKAITEVDLETEYLPLEGNVNLNGGMREVIKTREDNTVIIHKSKMYSEADMIKAYNIGFKNGTNHYYTDIKSIIDNL